jgi:Hypothetical glycosyl hydrolase family 15
VIALGLALLVVVSLSSASAATYPVAQRGISEYWFPSYTWGPSSLSRYAQVVVTNPGLIATTKKVSPQTKVLNFKDAMGLQDNCGTSVDTCQTAITYEQAQAHDAANPGDPWILRDSSGQPIPQRSFAHIWLANVGSASYQQQWVTNAIGADKRLGYNGTFIDNVLADVSSWAPAGVFPTLYRSDAAWQTVMVKFIAFVGPQLKAQGLYVRATAGKKTGSAAYKTWFQTIAPYVNGLENEYFEQAAADKKLYNIDPSDFHGDWLGWLGLVDVTQKAGVDFYGGMRGDATETTKMMYGKASFLLAWNGKGGGFFWQSKVPSADPWNPAWTTWIGTPTAARYKVGVGWRRNYSAGTVIVNPNAPGTGAITFKLGATYVAPNGKRVTSVTLQPARAMILSKTSSR